MNEVKKINLLGRTLQRFVGKDVSDSIQHAEEWADKHGVVLSSYYLQVADKRSIIVSYISKESEAE